MLSMLMTSAVLSLAAVEPELPALPANSLHAGAKSIGFALPTGGTQWRGSLLSGSYAINPHIALTLGLGGTFNRREVSDLKTTGLTNFNEWDVSLMPGLRYYMTPSRRLTPYVGGALLGSYRRRPISNTSGKATSDAFDNGALGVIGRFGAEWFIVPQVSLAGELGFWVDVIRFDYLLAPHVQTYHSQLVASFYW